MNARTEKNLGIAAALLLTSAIFISPASSHLNMYNATSTAPSPHSQRVVAKLHSETISKLSSQIN